MVVALALTVSGTIAVIGIMQGQRARNALEESQKEPKTPASTLPIAFGPYATLEGFQKADWDGLGKATTEITRLMAALYECIEEEENADPELQEKIRHENAHLVKYAAGIMGDIPTSSPINGEYAHPLSLINLIAAALKSVDKALTADQKSAIIKIGEAFDRDYVTLQGGFGKNTCKNRRLVSELQLKKACLNRMLTVLTPGQREAIIKPKYAHRIRVDLFSPATMIQLIVRPFHEESLEVLKKRLKKTWMEGYKIPDEYEAEVVSIVDTYFEDVAPILQPGEEELKRPVHLDRAIAAGLANAKATEAMLALPGLSEKCRKGLLGDVGWRVPGIKKEEKPAK
jgi:hypothetical protein